MSLSKKQKICIAIGVGILVSLILLILGIVNSPGYRREQQKENDQTDGLALHSIIAEAYLNINADPEFINTAVDDRPMEIPEKYYTYVESVQGDGRVHVVVYADGHVDAYFGSPEKTRTYYLRYSFR